MKSTWKCVAVLTGAMLVGCSAGETAVPESVGAFIVYVGGSQVVLAVNARNGLRARVPATIKREVLSTLLEVDAGACGTLEFVRRLPVQAWVCNACFAVDRPRRPGCDLSSIETQLLWQGV